MAKHSIFILDDEENIINALTRLLRGPEREIFTAGTAGEAWARLKEIGGADLIISDNRLPDISGIDFLVKVRQLYPDTIRILITGYPGLDSAIEAINKGQVYRYIPKPWENEELKLIVKQAFDYYDVMKDNRVLLRLARKQAQVLIEMQKKYPQVSRADINKTGLYIIDEQEVSDTLSQFMQKYYPNGIPGDLPGSSNEAKGK
ncbi:MAG: response regulator [Candidatus Omnitrophica bacterium]|nr:response regulator [Candidatus Omnitrophota bacterium]